MIYLVAVRREDNGPRHIQAFEEAFWELARERRHIGEPLFRADGVPTVAARILYASVEIVQAIAMGNAVGDPPHFGQTTKTSGHVFLEEGFQEIQLGGLPLAALVELGSRLDLHWHGVGSAQQAYIAVANDVGDVAEDRWHLVLDGRQQHAKFVAKPILAADEACAWLHTESITLEVGVLGIEGRNVGVD